MEKRAVADQEAEHSLVLLEWDPIWTTYDLQCGSIGVWYTRVSSSPDP